MKKKLFISTFVLIILFLAYRIFWGSNHKEKVITWAENNKARIVYGSFSGSSNFAPSVNEILQKVLGVRIKEIHFEYVGKPISEYNLLAEVPKLKGLTFVTEKSGTEFIDFIAKNNETLNSLTLRIVSNGHTDLKNISTLTRLTSLKIEVTSTQEVELKGLSEINKIKTLENLTVFARSNISIKDLDKLHNLKNLSLIVDSIDFKLGAFKNLSSLKHLRIKKGTLSDDQINKIKEAIPNCYIDNYELPNIY